MELLPNQAVYDQINLINSLKSLQGAFYENTSSDKNNRKIADALIAKQMNILQSLLTAS